MSEPIKNYFSNVLRLDECGRSIINDQALLENINGAINYFEQIPSWDLSCNGTCGCNPSCFNNKACDLSCPEPPNVGCDNANC